MNKAYKGVMMNTNGGKNELVLSNIDEGDSGAIH